MKKIYILLIIVFLFTFQLVSAITIQQLPVTQSNGIVIESPIFDHLKIETNHTFFWNVYNLSNGILLSNISVDCSFKIFHNDNIIFQNLDVYGSIIVNDTYFSEIGDYSRLIQCNSSNYGDFSELSFRVGYNNFEATIQDALIYSLLILILISFFIVTLIFAYSIDGENQFTLGPSGERLIEINAGKFVKLFLYLLAHLFFWMVSWASWKIADTFELSLTLSFILRIIFIVDSILWFPIIIMVTAIGLMKLFADNEALKLAKRGLMPR